MNEFEQSYNEDDRIDPDLARLGLLIQSIHQDIIQKIIEMTNEIKADVATNINELRNEMNKKIDALESKIENGINALESKIENEMKDLREFLKQLIIEIQQ